MLAFSTRSGVPARRVQAGGFCVGMLPLACSTPACPGSWSSCVFVGSTGYAFWLHALSRQGFPPSLSFTVLACSTGAFGADVRGSWSSCVFVRSTVLAFWGNAFLSARIPLWLSCLHRVGLQQFGEREGLSEQRALGQALEGCPVLSAIVQ